MVAFKEGGGVRIVQFQHLLWVLTFNTDSKIQFILKECIVNSLIKKDKTQHVQLHIY